MDIIVSEDKQMLGKKASQAGALAIKQALSKKADVAIISRNRS
ncbi:hypothetical protein AB6F62_10005 [Providencia huaxiensis]